MSVYAETIFKGHYAFNDKEDWLGCAARVSKFNSDGDAALEKKFFNAISTRKFLPGGRYLYSAGRKLPQITNCFLLRAKDSREGWGEILDRHAVALSLGGGVGTYYGDVRAKGATINRYGGVAGGPVSLIQMINEVARYIQAGGARRAALWAGLPWWHPDIEEFFTIKNWPTHIRALKEDNFEFPAPLDMTNVSVCLDDEFFKEIKKNEDVQKLYYNIVRQALKTGEPGFSVNIKDQSKQVLRNPCQPGWATVLTPDGIKMFDDIAVGSVIWSGDTWTIVTNKQHTGTKEVLKYETTAGSFFGTEEHRVMSNGIRTPVKEAQEIDICTGRKLELNDKNLRAQDVMDGLVIGDGGVHKASNNLVALYVGDNDKKDYQQSSIAPLMVKYRPGLDKKAWGVTTTILPNELPKTYDRVVPNRFFFGSSSVKLGFLRGLFSANGSVVGKGSGCRVTLKQTSRVLINQVQVMLSSVGIKSYVTTNKPRIVEHHNGTYTSRQSYDLNISTDRYQFHKTIGFIHGYKNKILSNNLMTPSAFTNPRTTYDIIAVTSYGDHEVYDITVDDAMHTYWTNGMLVSNCTEITSDTPYDCCNLGSINLSKIKDLNELEEITRIGVKFLYLGTSKGVLPHENFYEVRKKNHRIGLGLMGLHEFCIRNDLRYEPSGTLGKWLHTWETVSDDEAKNVAKENGGIVPIAVRSIAPTGTISIIGETTSGIEPIFCRSYKRRWIENGRWKYTYVIDPTAARLIQEGVSHDDIEDAYTLARDVERRLSMQAFIQDYVDQGISSTINLPEWGEPGNSNAKKFSEVLLKYLPKLRGITMFPEGSRPGQPLTPVRYETAIKHKDVMYEEDSDRCVGGVCGI